MKNKEFGTAWWVLPTENNKYAVVESTINIGVSKFEDLTDEQIENCKIEIFDTKEKANEYRLQKILKQIK